MNKQLLRTWHRRVGALSVLMVLWLAASGIAINHGDALGLNKTLINHAFLNELYGLEAEGEAPEAIEMAGSLFFCYEGNLYRDAEVLSWCDSSLLSVRELSDQYVLLNATGLFVLGGELQFLEFLSFTSLGSDESKRAFNRLWQDEYGLLLYSESEGVYRVDLFNLEFSRALTQGEIKKDDYLEYVSLPASLEKKVMFPGVSLERILLDAHSGRLLGSFGVLLVDFFAIAFVLIGLSGILIYFKRYR